MMKKIITCLFKFCLVILLTSQFFLSQAEARVDGAFLNDVTMKLETPHTKWAKPYALGKTKIFAVCPSWSAACREVVELFQRFEVEYEAATTFWPDHFVALQDRYHRYLEVEGQSWEEKVEEFSKKLENRYDCILLANVSFNILPKEIQFKILKQVRNGTGLVTVFQHGLDSRVLSQPLETDVSKIYEGVPLSGLSEIKKLPSLIKTYSWGKGRIVCINYPPPKKHYGNYDAINGLTPEFPYSRGWETIYDYYLIPVINAILWATDRLPQVNIEFPMKDGLEVKREELPKRLGSVTVKVPELGLKNVKTLVRIRSVEGKMCWDKNYALDVSSERIRVPIYIPLLTRGGYFLDVIVSSDRGKEAWASHYLKVTSSIKIDRITTDKEFYEKGEILKGKVILKGDTSTPMSIRVYLEDTYNRVWKQMEREVPLGKDRIDFSFLLDHSKTIASYIVAEMFMKGKKDIVDRKGKLFYTPRRYLNNEFPSLIWGQSIVGSPLVDIMYRQVEKAGFNIMLGTIARRGQFRFYALHNLVPAAYIYRILLPVDGKCFMDEAHRKKLIAEMHERTRQVMKYRPFLYSLGDENHFSYNAGYSEADKAAFRKYLKKIYPNLNILNQEWETDFRSWKEVEPFSRNEARKLRKTAAEHDRMAFLEKCYADYYNILAAAIREVDPKGLIGAEGSDSGNLEETIAKMDFWGPYQKLTEGELLRSLSPSSKFFRGSWWGGYVWNDESRKVSTIASQKNNGLWWQIMRGRSNIDLFYSLFSFEGILNCDFSYAKFFQGILPELKEIYGGLGQLISGLDLDSEVAILYSQVSNHVATVYPTFGLPSSSQEALLKVMDRLGMGYTFVTASQVVKGKLKEGSYKILFLPIALALSEEEVKAIRDYVERGGIVIADIIPGIANGHGRILKQGQLDSFFGITRVGDSKLKDIPLHAKGRVGKVRFKVESLHGKLAIDSSVKVINANSLYSFENIPFFIYRNVGQGKVILLNTPLHKLLPALGRRDREAFLLRIFKLGNVIPLVKAENIKPDLLKIFKGPEIRIVNLILPKYGRKDGWLSLNNSFYIYDVRARKYIAHSSKIFVSKKYPRIRVFALFDKEQKEPLLTTRREYYNLGETVQIDVALKGMRNGEGRIVRLEIYQPDGKEKLPYRGYLKINKIGKAKYSIPLAYNDPIGKWEVVAIDIATGLQARTWFNVRIGKK